MFSRVRTIVAALVAMLVAGPAFAADQGVVAGNSAWVLTASALVLFMTLPGLGLFYGGLVRARNLLSVLMHCFVITCLVSILWILLGYSLAFTGTGPLIGTLARAPLSRMADALLGNGLPEPVFALFQLTFAVITPALIIGAFVERISFAFLAVFAALWLLVVYVPVTHWVWGGGWLAGLGTLDFAGGIVVHTTAGVSALVAALLVGPRRGFPHTLVPPHNPGLTMMGAGMLWVGWFGFNGGSALMAGGSAAWAIIATQLASSAAGLAWMAMEWFKIRKPTSVGFVTGCVAGLATVTPTAGYVGPMGAIAIGVIGGLVCFSMTWAVKHHWRLDDTLDVFAVHGVGGMLGSVLVALFILPVMGGVGLAAGMDFAGQVKAQVMGVVAVAAFVLVKILGLIMRLRVSPEDEITGLDLASHGEVAYAPGESALHTGR